MRRSSSLLSCHSSARNSIYTCYRLNKLDNTFLGNELNTLDNIFLGNAMKYY